MTFMKNEERAQVHLAAFAVALFAKVLGEAIAKNSSDPARQVIDAKEIADEFMAKARELENHYTTKR